ncbi:MAG: GAF domain-containing protein [Thermoproteota archaeon]|nr:GAF domain-containing protein [Thermoproteota archaeon]
MLFIEKIMLDTVDKIILAQLGKNARLSSQELQKILQDTGHAITDRGVRHRIQKLEKNNIILGYSAIINPNIISEKINRTVLLKFKYGKSSQEKIKQLTDYVNQSSFCLYSNRLSGDYDWICNFIFDSIEQYELESDNFLNRFSSLISDFRSYESKMIKSSPYSVYDDEGIKEKKEKVFQILNSVRKYNTLNDRLQAIVENLVKYFDAAFARIWFVDKDQKYLILKFSAGMYTGIKGEFSKVSINSLKIGPVVKTKKAVVTNDVVNDPRIKHPDWAKRENLKSYAAYPLIYKGKSVAVLAMFSKKKLTHVEFDVLGIFCDQLSKELTGFFEAKDFLFK